MKARQQWNAWRADGLYRVKTGNVCASFVVRGHRIVECAPILRRYPGLLAIAERVEERAA